ncbi:MAG TPA: hypothetical protein PLL33_12970 [Paracoccus sp. (in: a-proteobacteria)]|mgnify:CR=1 FL=1|nr:hypothetical protein [Paracoccus sp. (in: a-proteobacteria)]
MCSGCGFPATPGHWTEAAAPDAGERLRARLRQMGVANRMLRPWGLSVADAGGVPGFQLSDGRGDTRLVRDLGALWEEAARMLGHPVDPLDERTLTGATLAR